MHCGLILIRAPLFFPHSNQDMTAGKSPSMLERLRTIHDVGGTRALFAGVVPRTLWIGAGGAVFLGAYEWAVQLLVGTP